MPKEDLCSLPLCCFWQIASILDGSQRSEQYLAQAEISATGGKLEIRSEQARRACRCSFLRVRFVPLTSIAGQPSKPTCFWNHVQHDLAEWYAWADYPRAVMSFLHTWLQDSQHGSQSYRSKGFAWRRLFKQVRLAEYGRGCKV